jgi:hypothetical protein
MNKDKLLYWGLVVGTVLIFAVGIWICFFAKSILLNRAKLAEQRLGPKAVVFLLP